MEVAWMSVDYTKNYGVYEQPYRLSFFGMSSEEALPIQKDFRTGYDNRFNIDENNNEHPSWKSLRLDIRDKINSILQEKGRIEFHVNLNRGSDFIFAEEVARIKRKFPENVKLVAHAVSENYSDRWGTSAKRKLSELQKHIDETIVASDRYTSEAVGLNRANMIRSSDEILFFWNGIDTTRTQTSQAVIDAYNQNIKSTSMGKIYLRDKQGKKTDRIAFPTDVWLLTYGEEEVTNESGMQYKNALKKNGSEIIITSAMREEISRQNKYAKYSKDLDDSLSPYMSENNKKKFIRGHKKLFRTFDADKNFEKTMLLIKALNMMGISYEVQEPNLKNGSISLSLNDGSNGWVVASQSTENQKNSYPEYQIGSYSTALERLATSGVRRGLEDTISILLNRQGVEIRSLLNEHGLGNVPTEGSPGYNRYLRKKEELLYSQLNDTHKMLLVSLPVLYGTGKTVDALGIDGGRFVQEKDAKNISTRIALVIEDGNAPVTIGSAINFIQKDPDIKTKYGDRSNNSGTKQFKNLTDVLGFDESERRNGAAEKFIADRLRLARENYVYALINGEYRSEQFDAIHDKYVKRIKKFEDKGINVQKAMIAGLQQYVRSFNSDNVILNGGVISFSGDFESSLQEASRVMEEEFGEINSNNSLGLISEREEIKNYFREQILAMNGFLGDGYTKFNIPNMAMLQETGDVAKEEKILTNAFIQSRIKSMASATGSWNQRKIASRLLEFDKGSSISYTQIKQLRAFESTKNLDIDANGHAKIDGKIYDMKKYPKVSEVNEFDANSARSLKNLEYVFDKISDELKNSSIYPSDKNDGANSSQLSDIRIDKNGLVHWSGYRAYRYNIDSTGRYIVKTAPISGTLGQVFVQDSRLLVHVEEAGHGQGENLTFVPSLIGYLVDPVDDEISSLAKLTRVKQYNEYLSENVVATLRKQLSRGTAMDVSRLEETFSVNSLYHGQEDILEPVKKEFLVPNNNKSQEYIDAVIQTLAVRVKYPKFLGDELGVKGMYNSHVEVLNKTKYVIEKNYLNSILHEAVTNGISVNEVSPERRKVLKRKAMEDFFRSTISKKNKLVGNYFTNHGGVSIRDIAHESNRGIFSQDFSGNGSSLGRQRYIGSLDQIKSNGEIEAIVRDGQPVRIKTPIERLFPSLFEDFEKSPSDRKIPFSKQILEASGITDNTKVMMMDLSGLTDEDACVITKDYAERAAHPVDWEESKKEHKLMFTDSVGKDRIIEDYIGMQVSLTNGSESRRFMLTVLDDSGIPMKPEYIPNDFDFKQKNVRLVELRRNGAFFKPSNRSLKELSAGEKYIFDGIGKVTVVEIQNDGKKIRNENERLKSIPVRVGDKLTELSGNKMTVSKIVDTSLDVDDLVKNGDFHSKQEARIIAVFKASGAEISVNPYTPLSRKNAAQLAQLSKHFVGNGETVKFVDPVTKKLIDTGAQVSKMDIVLTNKQASKGSTVKGRKYSQQLAWADLERGGEAIVSEVFKDNEKSFEEFREHALVAGYAIDENGEVHFSDLVDSNNGPEISVEQLINEQIDMPNKRKTPLYRLVLAYGFGDGHDTIRTTPKKKNPFFMKENKLDVLLGAKANFKKVFSNRAGTLVLPTKIKLYSNVETDKIRVIPPSMRRARENQDKRIISSEYTKKYEEIVTQSARYMFYENVKLLVAGYSSEVLFTNYKNDGKTSNQLRDEYLREVNKRLDNTRERLQAVVTQMSEIAAVKKIGKDTKDLKSGAIRAGLNSKQMKQGVTAVMANGSVDCDLNEIHISERLSDNFKGMVQDKDGYLHIKRAIPKNIMLNDNGKVEVLGELPQGYELLDDGFLKDSDGHLIDVSYGGDVKRALLHFHRDPVWHSTGTIATYAKVRDDIDGVLVNAAVVGMLDGDFDGDNSGVIPLYTDGAQEDLARCLSLENNLVNIGSDEKNPTLNISVTGGVLRGAINSGYISSLPREERIDSDGNDLNPKKALEKHLTKMVVQGGIEKVNGKEFKIIGYSNEDRFTREDVKLSRENTLEFLQELYNEFLENSFEKSGIRVDCLENSVTDLKQAIDLGLKGKTSDLATFLGYATGKNFGVGEIKFSEELARKFSNSGYSSKQLDIIQKNGVMFTGSNFDYDANDTKVNIANAAKSENTGIPGQKEQEMVSALRAKGGLREALEVMYPIMQANLQVKHNADDALKMTEAFRNQLQSLMEGKDSNPRVIFHQLPNDPDKRLEEQTKFAILEYNEEFLDSEIDYIKNGRLETKKVKELENRQDIEKKKEYDRNYPKYYGKSIPEATLSAKTFTEKFKYIMDNCNVSVDSRLLERMATYLSGEDPKLTDKTLNQMKITPVKDIIQKDTPALEFANSQGEKALRAMALSNLENRGKSHLLSNYLFENEKLDVERSEQSNSFYTDKIDENLQLATKFARENFGVVTDDKQAANTLSDEMQNIVSRVAQKMSEFRKNIDLRDESNRQQYGLSMEGIANATYRELAQPVNEINGLYADRSKDIFDVTNKLLANKQFIRGVVQKYNDDINIDSKAMSTPILPRDKIAQKFENMNDISSDIWKTRYELSNSQISNFRELYDFVRKESDIDNPVRKSILKNIGFRGKVTDKINTRKSVETSMEM